MIFDNIENAQFYYGLGDKFKAAFEYLQKNDLENIENGRYEIKNDDIFVIIQDYQSKPESQGKWEAHKKYIDIQYIIKGEERLGFLPINEFSPEREFDEGKDIVFGTGSGYFLNAKAGEFVVFTPKDAHMPGICVNSPVYVKKAVVKVKV